MKKSVADSQLIRLHNAGLREGADWRVRGVDMTIKAGEIITLVGPNGSGKSSTASMVLGISKPAEGTMTRREKLVIGYVPQKLSIDWTLPLTVERIMCLTNRLNAGQIDKALERTGAAHLLKAQVRQLSGGEFQRVLMARAIAREPDLLVLDEPVQGVDVNGQIALYQLIASLRDDLQCGVLLVSHDLHLVMAATDKVICLNGHMCCHGTPLAVTQSAEYQQLFGGAAASALAFYEHDHDHVHLPDGTVRHADGSVTDHCHPNDGHHHHAR